MKRMLRDAGVTVDTEKERYTFRNGFTPDTLYSSKLEKPYSSYKNPEAALEEVDRKERLEENEEVRFCPNSRRTIHS